MCLSAAAGERLAGRQRWVSISVVYLFSALEGSIPSLTGLLECRSGAGGGRAGKLASSILVFNTGAFLSLTGLLERHELE